MKFLPIIIFCILCTVSQMGFAQPERKHQALLYYEAGRYYDALIEFNAYKKTDKDPQMLIKRALCQLYTNHPDGAIKDLVAADKLKSLDNKRYKYIAMSYLSKYEYGEAAKFFKTYLNTINPSSADWNDIINYIKKCGFASNYKYRPQIAYVENLGQGVNTKFDEFGPVQSPTRPERYYFSSAREGASGGLRNAEGLSDVLRGHYSADMYMVDLMDGNWSTVLTFGSLMNTPKNDILQDFSQDGSVVFYLKKGNESDGILFTDTFNVENIPSQMSADSGFPFDASKGDKDLFVFNDSLIVFSSQKDEGLGGYDIYYSFKIKDIWQAPVNFKFPINSSANEQAPFLIKNGSTLYFSSDRLETYGGYDIFSANFTIEGKIDQVYNLGYPINSPGNDIDPEISHDGMFALFASDRVEGFGGKDLFTAYFKDQVTGMLESVELPSFVSYFEKNLSASSDSTTQNIVQSPSSIPQRDFVSKSIYFDQDEDVLNIANQNTLKSIADLMLIYPELKVQLFSHSTSDGKKDFDLYFSIKRAEKSGEFLTKSGINERRIYLYGCGANYPIAAPYINNIPSTLAKRTNRRIDFNIIHTEDSNLNIMYDYPAVAGQYRDSLWDDFMATNKGITFRIHFANVVQMLKNEILGLSNDIIVQKNQADKVYTYTIGNFTSLDEAIKMQNFLKTKGFEKSRVVPYYNGVELNRLDLLKLSAEYPDIQRFLSLGE